MRKQVSTSRSTTTTSRSKPQPKQCPACGRDVYFAQTAPGLIVRVDVEKSEYSHGGWSLRYSDAEDYIVGSRTGGRFRLHRETCPEVHRWPKRN